MPLIDEHLTATAAKHVGPWLAGVLGFLVALFAAWAAHAVLTRIVRRVAARSRSPIDDVVLQSLGRPSRFLLFTFVAVAALPALPLSAEALAALRRILGLVLIGAFGWMLVGAARAGRQIVEQRFDVTVADNLRARRARTRAGILYRIALAIIVVLVTCLALMTFPSVRHPVRVGRPRRPRDRRRRAAGAEEPHRGRPACLHRADPHRRRRHHRGRMGSHRGDPVDLRGGTNLG